MTEETWTKTLLLFAENEKRLIKMKAGKPIPGAKFWRDSAHGTLGHLTACQAAWLPLMKMLEEGQAKGSVAIRPDPLYTKLGFKTEDWTVILKQFRKERTEWRRILKHIDLKRTLKTPTRTQTVQTLTRRLVDHERRHLDDLAQNR